MAQDRTEGCETGGRDSAGRRCGHKLKHRVRLTQLTLGAVLLALAVSAMPAPARAGDGDSSDPSVWDKFMNTLGIKDPNDTEYEINYSERSPLVVPPSRDLPPPIAPSKTPVPNWPKDPDMARRQAAKEDDKPKVRPFDSVMESSRPLRPNELNVGRASTAAPQPGVGEQSSPSQLGEPNKSIFSFDWMKKEQYATFTGEPPRANLTDPPPGYLTPSPDQPYGIAPEKKVYKPPTLGERLEAPR